MSIIFCCEVSEENIINCEDTFEISSDLFNLKAVQDGSAFDGECKADI